MERNTEIFYDGADIAEYYDQVRGFTTNPSILRAHGVVCLLDYAKEAVREARGKPISFQLPVLRDTERCLRMADEISELGDNVYVKVPIIDEDGRSTSALLAALQRRNIKLNVTAVFSERHIDEIRKLSETEGAPAIVSIFAGKISDTGEDPTKLLKYAKASLPLSKILWAGCRSVYDYCTAAASGADIVTAPAAVLQRMCLLNQSVEDVAVSVVRQFVSDGSHLC